MTPPLPPSAFADTEASTNIVIAPLVGGRTFTVMLSLDATDSNCVEFAVGHDAAPADGALSHAEASLQFGWDARRDSAAEARCLFYVCNSCGNHG